MYITNTDLTVSVAFFWRTHLRLKGLPVYGLDIVPDSSSLEAVLKEMAASHYGQGGESEDHRVLKEYVKAHPECIGLKHAFTSASTERLLLSGDEIDVFFCSPTKWVCIEVKGFFGGSLKSNQNDILRGIFQCVKYKAVLEAEQVYLETAEKPAINVCLVLSSTLQDDLQRVAKLLDIPVESNITVPSDFILRLWEVGNSAMRIAFRRSTSAAVRLDNCRSENHGFRGRKLR